jgi:hypothetical protein
VLLTLPVRCLAIYLSATDWAIAVSCSRVSTNLESVLLVMLQQLPGCPLLLCWPGISQACQHNRHTRRLKLGHKLLMRQVLQDMQTPPETHQCNMDARLCWSRSLYAGRAHTLSSCSHLQQSFRLQLGAQPAVLAGDARAIQQSCC